MGADEIEQCWCSKTIYSTSAAEKEVDEIVRTESQQNDLGDELAFIDWIVLDQRFLVYIVSFTKEYNKF